VGGGDGHRGPTGGVGRAGGRERGGDGRGRGGGGANFRTFLKN
jgi:hypothetical protein